MKPNSLRRDRQSLGYSLIEATIVLGIAGLIIGAIFAAWAAVNSQNKMRRAEDQLTVIVSQIRTTYGNRNALDNTTDGNAFTNALVNAGLLPDSWIENFSGTNQLGNPYGGNIVITPDSMPSSSVKDAINVTLGKVDKVDCYKLVSNMLGAGRTQGLFKIDGTTVNNSTAFKDIKSSVCTSNNVKFYFSLKSGT